MINCNEKVLLSIVIPVYNVERYLEECVDSIYNQMTDACELVLVDDGSTDLSGVICDRYAHKSPNVKVIHQENRGQSFARNAGLSIAKGRYVTFVDSDDKISFGSIPVILDWISTEGTDLCFLQCVKWYSDGTTVDMGECIQREAIKGKSPEEAMQHLASRPKYSGSPCTKLYKTSMLLDNGLSFPCDRRCAEDLKFVFDCILCAQTFDVLTVPYYQYRQNRQGSVTNQITYSHFVALLQFVEEVVEKTTENRHPKDLISKCAMSFAAYEYSIAVWQYNFLGDDSKENAYQLLKKYKWVMKYAKNLKSRIIYAGISLMGIKPTVKLLHCLKRR